MFALNLFSFGLRILLMDKRAWVVCVVALLLAICVAVILFYNFPSEKIKEYW